MMITVHGLPSKTKFQDVKVLIKQVCNIPDFILDSLVDDGYDSKKVRIGLTNEDDGYRLMKCLEGFRMSGSHVLRAVPVNQSQATFEQRPVYSNQSRNDYPNQTPSYGNQNDFNRPNTVNTTSLVSPHAVRGDTRHNDRGMMDSRPSLTQVTNHPKESRVHYQDSGHRRDQDTRSDFRDPTRGPLVPPTLRPASLNARVHGIDSRNISDNMRGPERPDIRGQDGIRGADVPLRGIDRQGMRSDAMRSDVDIRGDPSYPKSALRQATNPQINRQLEWTPAGTDQWSDGSWPMQHQGSGYNYPQAQGNVGYGVQPNPTPQGGFPNRGSQPQPYQQQPKATLAPERPLASSRSHVLRSVEIVNAPIQPRAQTNYPQMQKPITIMKDNFQGPTQYNMSGVSPAAPYQAQAAPQPWTQPLGPQSKPYEERHLEKAPKGQDYEKRRFSPPRARPASPGRSLPYPDRRGSPRPFRSPNRHTGRFSPTRRDISPSKLSPRRNSPRKMSPRRNSPGRRVSPRRISPFNRKTSPFGRKVSPTGQRRISPFGRKVSPTGQRRISPFGRKVSPTGQRRISPTGQRRISPFGRKASPPGQRRVSPFGRKVSPGRRVSPKRDELRRTSPSMTKYDYYVEDDRRMGARESPTRRYSPKRSPLRGSGRYSPSQANYGRDDKDVKGIQNRPAYEAKQAQKYTGAGFRPIETQYPAPARNDPKISPWQSEKIVYPPKDEARPNPLEESRKKMLSPRRSRSRSPVKDRFRRHSPSPRSPRRSWALEKRRSPEILPPPPPLWPGQEEEKPKRAVWERNVVPERFGDKHRDEDKYRNEDKFGTRASRFSPRRDTAQYSEKLDNYEEGQYRKSPRADKKLFPDVDKDFDDIYQRAVELRRKTEELRKSHEHRTRYDDEEQRRDKSPVQDKSKLNWIPVKPLNKLAEGGKIRLVATVKEKRDKATEEIASRILEPHNFTGEQRARVMDELKFNIFNMMIAMFKDKDVSYIELVIKFRARYDAKDEEKILMDVLESMPSHYKDCLKRKGDGISEVPAKNSKPTPAYSNSVQPRVKLADNKYSSHSSARLKDDSRDSRKRTRDERDTARGSTGTRKIIRTDNRPRPVRRSNRLSSPTYKERKYKAATLNQYEEAYENQPKTHLKEQSKTYEPPKVYIAKPVVYSESKNKNINNQPSFEDKPKIQGNTPYDQDVKGHEHKDETMRQEKQSVAEQTRPKRFNELSPLMTSMVEDELKNIMIKIWQTLPDDALNGAEMVVLDKLKNDAGDDLRNTLGLNITKRLLNVNSNPSHKGLLIKVQMHSSVTSQDVYQFTKKYHISNFKYVQQRTYAGRMQSWTELDQLYSARDLRCGNSKVTITPIYNFLKCPPMLKTVFDGKQDYTSKEIEKEAAKKISKPEGKLIITADKVLAEDAKKVEVKKEIISKEKADKKVESKTDTKECPKNTAPKADDKKSSATKSSESIHVQKETGKQSSTKTDTKVANAKTTEATASKPVIPSNIKKDIKSDTNVEPPKKAAPITTTKKETVAPKAVETKPNPVKVESTTPVTQPAKTTQSNDSIKTVVKGEENKQESKTVAKEPAKSVAKAPAKNLAKEAAKPVANDAKPVAMKPTVPAKKETDTPKPPEKKTVVKTSPVVPKTAKMTKATKVDPKANDFDELDDHDILALLSGGIVLDECTGSDDD